MRGAESPEAIVVGTGLSGARERTGRAGWERG